MIADPLALSEPDRGRTRSLRVMLLCLTAAALAVLSAFLAHPLVVGLACTIVGLMFAYLLGRGRVAFDYFEIFVLVSLLHLACYGMGALYFEFNPTALRNPSLLPYVTPSLALATAAYAAYVAGYAWTFRRVASSPIGRLWPRGILPFVVLGGLGFVGHVSSAAQGRFFAQAGGISSVASLLQQTTPLFIFSWFLVWYCFWSRQGSLFQRAVLFLVFVPLALVVLYVTVGGKALAITILSVPAVTFYYVKRKLPLKTILFILLVAVLVIFPVYNTFRTTNARLDVSRRMSDALYQIRSWDQSTFQERSVFAFLGRMGIISSTAAVLRDVGRTVDLQYGKKYFLLPATTLIPRSLWPNKPALTTGREFGWTFRLVSPNDVYTFIAPSSVGELFWDFHVPGVLLGFFLIGGLQRWIYKKYGEGGVADPVRKAAYFVLLSSALELEGGVALWVVANLRFLALLAVLVFVFRRIGWLTETSEERPRLAAEGI